MAAPSFGTIVFALHGPIAPEDVRWMCERVRSLLASSGDDHVICDVGAVTTPDAGTVEALARMQLAAQRLGGRLKLRRACEEMKELLTMSGLSDVLPCDELVLEAGRHAEQGEPTRGVQEKGDPVDPVA